MKQIVGAFSILLVLALNMFICAGVISASGQVAEAKEYKADVIAEVENSNFNPNVIGVCMEQASAAGYELQITNCLYDAYDNIQTAEVLLKYKYTIPVLGLEGIKSTRGIAR